MTLNTTIRRRAAFTLVELMVSAAVCVLIMAILSQAFVISTTSMRELKAVGDMQDQLRAAGVVIRDDLMQHHFMPEDGRENKGLRLSDQRLDQLRLVGNRLVGWTPPAGGFVRVRADGASVFDEGPDNDQLRSYRASNHYLHFTSFRPGGRDTDVYSTSIAGTTLTSPAAEIAIFLDPNPTGNTGTIPTYNLVRRQRLLAMNVLELPKFQSFANQPDGPAVLSVSPGAFGPNTPNMVFDVTDPRKRLGGQAMGVAAAPQGGFNDNGLSPASGGALQNRIGDDVLLSNVISFKVQLLWTPAVNANGVTPREFGTARYPNFEHTDFPFDFLPGVLVPATASHNNQPGMDTTFDTWSSNVPNWDVVPPPGPTGVRPGTATALPQRVRVKAIKIVLRVWDQKLKLSRQMTIFQDL